jgi:hypothetical protein
MGTRFWPGALLFGCMVLGPGIQVHAQGTEAGTSAGAELPESKVTKSTIIEEEYELMTRDKYVATVKVRLSLMVRKNGSGAQEPTRKLVKDVLRSKVAHLVATQPSQASQLTAVRGFEDTRRGLMSALETRLGEALAQERVLDTDYSKPRVAVLSWRLKDEEVIRQKRADHEAKADHQTQRKRCIKARMALLFQRSRDMEQADRRTIEARQKEIYLEGRLSDQAQLATIGALRRRLSDQRHAEVLKAGKAAQTACGQKEPKQPPQSP